MRVPERNIALGVGVGVGAVLGGIWAWRHLTAEALPHTWEEVGEVSELIIYPVKSARGIQIKDAKATTYGLSSNLLEDRSFMVINNEGTFITIRQVATLAAVVTQWQGQTLTLKAENMEDVSINIGKDLTNQPILEANVRGLKLPGIDCGDKVAEWLTKVLYNGETKVRLLYKGDLVKSRPARRPGVIEFKGYKESDKAAYADNSSYHLAVQSSLNDLNTRLAKPVIMENFRPNIVIKGSKAYDEDDWIYVKIGQVVLRRLKPCERCMLTTVDPITGVRDEDQEPMTTLKKYRIIDGPPELTKAWAAKPIFGITMGIDVLGHLAVGDKVSIARASVHPHLKGF